MSSVTQKRPGGSWVACFTDRDGKQRQKSTGTHDKGKAQAVADALEAPYRDRKLRARLEELGISIQHEGPGFRIRHGVGTFTGIPEDWIIRQRLSDQKAQGGGDQRLFRAVMGLAALEPQGCPGKLLPESKHLWKSQWSKLGEVVFSILTEQPDPNVFRKLDQALQTARESVLSDRRLTRAEQIYWFAACFFEKHRRTPTRAELETLMEELEVPIRTIQKSIRSWEQALADKGKSWKIKKGHYHDCLEVEEFRSPADLQRARSIHFRLMQK